MGDVKAFSLADLKKPETNNTKYDEVEAYGGMVRISSLSSADMLEWIASNGDPEKRKRAGLRLLVKAIVDAEGTHYPAEEHEALIPVFAAKDAIDNGKVLESVLKLNGFPTGNEKKPATLEEPAKKD